MMCEPIQSSEPLDTDGLDRWFFGGTPPPGERDERRSARPHPQAEPQKHAEPQPA